MRQLSFLVACFFFFVLQMLLAPRIAIGEVAPDFALLFVVYFAINRGPVQGSVAGFFVGLIQDLFNPELLGLNALTKSLAGFGLGVAGSKAEPGNILFLAALFAITAVAHDFVYLLFFTGLHLGRFFILWVTVSIPSAVYTAIVGVIVHLFATYVGHKVVRSFGKAR